jgi:hypothetical protein
MEPFLFLFCPNPFIRQFPAAVNHTPLQTAAIWHKKRVFANSCRPLALLTAESVPATRSKKWLIKSRIVMFAAAPLH